MNILYRRFETTIYKFSFFCSRRSSSLGWVTNWLFGSFVLLFCFFGWVGEKILVVSLRVSFLDFCFRYLLVGCLCRLVVKLDHFPR